MQIVSSAIMKGRLMNFIHSSDNFKLRIDKKVSVFFKNYQDNGDFKTESGGIIIGVLHPAQNEIYLTDISTPQPTDKRSSTSFIRTEKGHQQIMNDLWEESNYTKLYLGEWHTHNQNIPIPSGVDLRNWKTISQRNHISERLFFIIVGKKEIRVWMCHNQIIYFMNF